MSYNQGGPYRPHYPAYANHQRFRNDGTPLYDRPVQHPPHPRPPPLHQAPGLRGPPTFGGHDGRPQDARLGGAYPHYGSPPRPPPQGHSPNQHQRARIPQPHHSGRQQYEPSGRRSRSPDNRAGPSSVPYQRPPFRDRHLSYNNDRPLRPPPPTGGSRHPPSPRSDHNGPRHPKVKRRTEPRDEYLVTSLQPSTRLDSPSEKKLILLDLNGSLVFRAHKQNSDLFRRRPFVTTFIEYLRQRWEVGVWSSAQPHSVEKMVQSIGLKAKKVVPATKAEETDDTTDPVEVVEVVEVEPTDGESDTSLTLKVLWARDTFGLTKYEYNQKTETIKDLDSIWKHLNEEEEKSSSAPYSALNTLLLDDSYTKTSCQPFNHLPIPDFGQSLAFDSARAYRAALAFKKDGDNMSAELSEELGTYVVDRSLLGVIGILERARAESNVTSWIRKGGLVPNLSDANGWWNDTSPDSTPPSGGSKPSGKKMKKSKLRNMLSSTELSSLIFPPTPDTADLQPTQAQLLPTANPPIPWYASPAHLSFWIQQGVDALLEMGIELDFSMTIDFLPPTKEEVEVNRAKRQAALEKEQAEAGVAAAEEEGDVLPEVQI